MNKQNPRIKELRESNHFELIAELSHQNIKEFVLDQALKGGRMVRIYMIYQIIMIAAGSAIFTYSVVEAFKQNMQAFYYCIASILFCFTALIVIHELIHGIAIKLTGAPKVSYGANLKKFIFYAEADQYVMNRRQFTFIAITPLIVVKLVSAIGVLLCFNQPAVFAFSIIMCTHSLFCAGDISLLSLFYRHEYSEVYTFDLVSEQKSFYYMKR